MRLLLTKKNIDRELAAYTGGDLVIHDAELRGFMLRVRGKRRTFQVRYGGRRNRQRVILGEYGELIADDARTEALKVLGDAAKGLDPAAARRARRRPSTFGAWVDEYLEDVRQRKKRPREDERFLGWAKRRWGNKAVEKITAEDVERVFRLLASDGHKITANRWLASVRACLQKAWRLEKIPSNPAMKVRPLPENTPRDRVLTDEELDRLQDAIAAIQHPHVRLAFTFLLATGARVSEVLAARWRDIDLAAGEWRIPSPKAGHPQTVPLPRELVAFLSRTPRVGPYLVPGHNDPMQPRPDLKKPWDQLRKAAELEDLHLHDLRRTFGLRVARKAGLHVASKLLRHADVRVTERVYVPLGLAELRKASEKQARDLAKVLPVTQAHHKRKPKKHTAGGEEAALRRRKAG